MKVVKVWDTTLALVHHCIDDKDKLFHPIYRIHKLYLVVDYILKIEFYVD